MRAAPWSTRRGIALGAAIAALVTIAEQAHADGGTEGNPGAAGNGPGAGYTTDALPGVVRVPVAGPVERTGFGFAGSAGYGFTEGVLHTGDSHHRGFGSLAASFAPVPLFAAGLRFDGRYDASSGTGATSGWIGDPRIQLRVGGALGSGWALGAQADVWLPGSGAPSLVLDAITPDASVLASFAPPGSGVTIASKVGFRLDDSTKSASNADRLAASDRLALGLSQADGVLTGLGVAAHVSPHVEVLADATWDILVGTGAPGALDSPIVTSAGARIGLDPAAQWQLEAVIDASPSKRPPVGSGNPLVGVEPLVGGFVALAYRPAVPGSAAPPPVETAPTPTPAPAPTSAPAVAKVASVHGSVFAEQGHAALARANVTFKLASGTTKQLVTDASGSFAADDLEPGQASVEVTADGYQPVTRAVTLTPGTPLALDVPLAKALPVGQVRGLVRDYTGKAVAATVKVQPGDIDVQVGADGTFESNVAPGSYEVVIQAKGYAEQHRRVVVEKDGVTMLNVELRKGK